MVVVDSEVFEDSSSSYSVMMMMMMMTTMNDLQLFCCWIATLPSFAVCDAKDRSLDFLWIFALPTKICGHMACRPAREAAMRNVG
jgi:hypothetical protein